METRLLAAATLAVVLVAGACTGRGGNGDDDAADDDDDDVVSSATATATATPSGLGGIDAHVTCTGTSCRRGKLRTVVFDCATGDNVVIASSGTVTLVATTSVAVHIGSLPAPAEDCLHAIIDDTAGGTAVSGVDPHVEVVEDTNASVVLVIDTMPK